MDELHIQGGLVVDITQVHFLNSGVTLFGNRHGLLLSSHPLKKAHRILFPEDRQFGSTTSISLGPLPKVSGA